MQTPSDQIDDNKMIVNSHNTNALNHQPNTDGDYSNQIENGCEEISLLAKEATEIDEVELRPKPLDRSVSNKYNDSNHRRSLDFAKGLVNSGEIVQSIDSEDVGSTSSTPPPLPISRPPTIVSTILKADVDSTVRSKPNRTVKFKPPSPKRNEQQFEPIQVSRSNENLSIAVIKPIPRYPSKSKSTQDLSTDLTESEFGIRPMVFARSSDDLLMPDVDGLRKSMRTNRRWKMRSHESMNSIEYNDETEMYATNYVHKSLSQQLNDQPVILAASKKPLPLPRSDFKKIVYVFDKQLKEFVQDDAHEGTIPLDRIKISLSNASLTESSPSQYIKSPSIETKQRRKFSFFGFGQKKMHYGSQQQLPTVMDESNPLYRIRSMEDLVERNPSSSYSLSSVLYPSIQISTFQAQAKSVFYVPNPSSSVIAMPGQPDPNCK